MGSARGVPPVGDVLGTLGRQHGASWAGCLDHREVIEQRLRSGLRLTKVHRLLRREGVEPYGTLHRFAVAEFGFGRQAPTIAVLDGEPAGSEESDPP